MKLLVNREALADALSFATDVVKVRTPKPVLTAVELTAEKKSLSILGTDMEVAVRWSVGAVDITEPGKVVIPAVKLGSIISSLSDDTLCIESGENEQTIIKGSNSHFKVFGYLPSDFPPVDIYTPADGDVMIGGPELARMIEQTEYAMAKEPSRYAVNAMRFDRKDGKLLVVSTDGYRLSMTGMEMTGAAFGHNVPRRAIGLLKVLLQGQSVCRIQFTPHVSTFAVTQEDGTLIVLRTCLGEEAFPSYDDILPKDVSRTALVDRERLLTAIRQASHMTNAESKGVRFSFAATKLTVSARAPEVGEGVIDIPCDFTGDPMEIGFNPQYVMEALKAMRAVTVKLEMSEPTKPLKLSGDAGAVAIVMPVNLS